VAVNSGGNGRAPPNELGASSRVDTLGVFVKFETNLRKRQRRRGCASKRRVLTQPVEASGDRGVECAVQNMHPVR
jgi:hypothetical protein